MAEKIDTHPPAEVLRAFRRGKLDGNASSVVWSHLEKCDTCREQVAAVSDDSLADPEGAAPRSGTRMPDKPVAQLPHRTYLTDGRPSIPGLPAELAKHPQYEIIRELGRGGMGVVYLARNRQMDRLEVLKVMGQEFLSQEGARQRFEREIKSAARLNHSNVVAAHSVLSFPNLLVFAMEYIEGEDLARVVKSRGPLPVAHACYCAYQAALGLQHAHEKGMVHRDIKPQNLMLARNGKKSTVKILDFGLAKASCEKGGQYELTGEGKMLGTPQYIAPEQILDAATADIRADIYSLGCSLYCLLTGSAPFAGGSLWEILQAHHAQEAKPLDTVRPDVPEALDAVVRKMMAKDPAERYQTPGEVAKALIPFIKTPTKPVSAASVPPAAAPSDDVWKSLSEPVPAPRPAAVPATAPPRRKRLAIGTGAAAGLLAVVAGLWAGGVFSVKVKTKDGIVVLENLPPGAEVLVDGERVTLRPADGKATEIQVAPGTHKVEGQKPGFTMRPLDVTVAPGERLPIGIRLEPITPAPAKTAVVGTPAPKASGDEVVQSPTTPPDTEKATQVRPAELPRPAPGSQTVPGPHPPSGRPVPAPVEISADEPDVPVTKPTRVIQEEKVGNSALVAITPDGRYGWYQILRPILMDLKSGKEIRSFPGKYLGVTCMEFTPDGTQAVTATREGALRLWNIPSGELVRTFEGGDKSTHHIAISADGKRVAATRGFPRFSPDDVVKDVCTVTVWDVATGRRVRSWDCTAEPIDQLTFSADGGRVLGQNWQNRDGEIYVLDLTTGKALPGLPGPRGHPGSGGLMPLPDGRSLLVGGSEAVFSWDIGRAAALKRFPQPADSRQLSLCGPRHIITSGGRLVPGAGWEHCDIRVWEWETGKLVRRLEGHEKIVTSLAASADGRYVLSGSTGGTVLFWELPP
jgi:serine/threonine protein kinase/WD40 repeat protein